MGNLHGHIILGVTQVVVVAFANGAVCKGADGATVEVIRPNIVQQTSVAIPATLIFTKQSLEQILFAYQSACLTWP